MADNAAFEEAKRLLAARRQAAVEAMPELPVAPDGIATCGLREAFLVDLVVKLLFIRGNLTGKQLCEEICLPYQGLVEDVLRVVKDEMLAAVRRGDSVREVDWEFALTEKGGNYARDVMLRNGYAGPAPVPLADYVAVAGAQAPEWQQLNQRHLREAMHGLVLSDDMLLKLGPAFNSGRSMFLYGHAGNGKTLISERMSASMRGGILLPHAVEAGGQVVQLFDPTHHEVLVAPEESSQSGDRRWLIIKRPFIIVGGELTMDDLEMVWDTAHHHYHAPMQMKANGGVFMIDDFGRQRMPARDLLNRWIVPLEKRYDFHTLAGGVQVKLPFNVLIIFSTNLAPKELVEEAFLRRIKYKIEIGDPTEEQFRDIFRNFCGEAGLDYRADMLDYLVDHHYRDGRRGFRATHPRDLILQLMDIARFNELKPELTRELLDAAVATYFVDLS